jgi:hypothetical protein
MLESGDDGWTSPISAIVAMFCFTPLVIFSYEPNVEKYFQENHFFFKMISSKIFYDEKHFTLKQTEH